MMNFCKRFSWVVFGIMSEVHIVVHKNCDYYSVARTYDE